MSTLIDARLNPIVGVLRRSGLLTAYFDCHIDRASMVITVFLLRLQEVVDV